MTPVSTLYVSWVFVHEKAYQVRDTAIESSVMTKVKGFGVYNDMVMDVADYVTPTQVGRGFMALRDSLHNEGIRVQTCLCLQGASVFCIITKMITTERQVQGHCPEVSDHSDSLHVGTH